MRGLRLSVYTNPLYKGCSLGGISDRCTEVTLVGDGVDEVFEPSVDAPPVRLVRRVFGDEVVVHAEPVGERDESMRWMAGGAFVASSDARFGRALRRLGVSGYCAVSLHDRSER